MICKFCRVAFLTWDKIENTKSKMIAVDLCLIICKYKEQYILL